MSDPTPVPAPTAAPNASWDPAAKPAPAATERGFVADLLLFAWENKLWWIVPSLVILVGLGLMVFLSSNDGFAPFFYALF
jgi:uncharacterized protein DUF5989